jgi:hypothetical protein
LTALEGGEPPAGPTIWNVVAAAVYVFAAFVAFALASGQLDPVGFAYYGVGVEWRMPFVLALLAGLQVVWIGDAIVLGRRMKSAPLWILLAVAAIVGPWGLVTALGQLDGWRYDQRSETANVVVGGAMMLVIATVYSLRRWAFHSTGGRMSEGK